ncbi:MAG: glycosyltransferase family 1 protein [Deltaproteobacteria bacterium]|jgi:glycosyltransferase EpsF|nr:glycosyltransferase family 1 protein [Deltaproteobacteria bacterium]
MAGILRTFMVERGSSSPVAPQAQSGKSGTFADYAGLSVAMLLGDMSRGGVEAVVMNYIRRLAGRKLEIDVILNKDSSFPQRRELESLNVHFHLIPAYSNPLAYHRALFALFRQRRYTIVHAHLNTINLFPLLAAWRAHIPVRICHNHSTAYWGEGLKTLLKYVFKIPARLYATDYFACGEYSGRWMFGNRLFSDGRVFVLPNAIEAGLYSFNPERRREKRVGLGLEDSCFAVGHVGRFVYQKNHDFLLKIFAAVKRQRPDASLLLIGEGELEQRIRHKAEDMKLSDSVKFLGVRDSPGDWYSLMDILILPSFYEGMPLVAVEAQANGLPCLFSDRVTSEALITENTVRLSLDQSPEVWAAEALRLSRCCSEYFPAAYSVEIQAETLFAAYRHLARRALGPQEQRVHSGRENYATTLP